MFVSIEARPIDGEDNKNLWSISGKMLVNGQENFYTNNVADAAYDTVSDLALSHNIKFT